MDIIVDTTKLTAADFDEATKSGYDYRIALLYKSTGISPGSWNSIPDTKFQKAVLDLFGNDEVKVDLYDDTGNLIDDEEYDPVQQTHLLTGEPMPLLDHVIVNCLDRDPITLKVLSTRERLQLEKKPKANRIDELWISSKIPRKELLTLSWRDFQGCQVGFAFLMAPMFKESAQSFIQSQDE